MRKCIVTLIMLNASICFSETLFEKCYLERMNREFGDTSPIPTEIAFIENKDTKKIDTVAKVLNFTDGCDDEGCMYSYWYVHDAKSCTYRKKSACNSEKQIKLNEIDPRSIKFQYGRVPDLLDGMFPNSPPTMATRVYVNEVELFKTVGRIDMDRLKRGWSLIYSKYCTGKKREF